uniref:Uncharacterized protein n=1 Tax=mine drainage metagenome TaxID=410659 RepID=E6QNX2_9ZZZZ
MMLLSRPHISQHFYYPVRSHTKLLAPQTYLPVVQVAELVATDFV